MRPSGRAVDAMRPVEVEVGFTKHAEGSCLIKCGDTHVLCTASVEGRTPPWLRNTGLGWVTAEYGMLPRATGSRNRREAASGKQSGRTQEIQRLIGRSLRAGVDRVALGERQITVDCDVELQISRATFRDTQNEEQISNIIDKQATREDRISISDDVILNNKSLDDLKDQVLNLHLKYMELLNE